MNASTWRLIKMRMPGFTAGSSLYKTGGHILVRVNAAGYHALGASESTAGAVVPQRCFQEWDSVCDEKCERECYKPEQPKPACRTICCVDGQPQLT